MKPDNLASTPIMIVAGEASGDVHGAGLVKALSSLDENLRFFGIGGEEMALAGVDILYDIEKIAAMGFSEVFSALKDILSSYSLLKKLLKEEKPALLILIDFAEFNIRLAKQAKRYDIPVFYYITPKVWVWRKKRVKKLARYVDNAGVILPFEEAYLLGKGVSAKYVGNPVLDAVQVKMSRQEFCKKYSIEEDRAIVGILPGSRRKEVAFLLPVFLEAAKRMQQKYSRELTFVLPLASTLTIDDLNKAGLEKYKDDLDIRILKEDRYDLMAACDAVAAASGTVTLELAVLDVPMVVAYMFSPISYFVGRFLIDIPYFSLVNIIAGKNVVTELLQNQVHPAAVEIELARILFDENAMNEIKKGLSVVRRKVGGKGASQKAAKLALETLKKHGKEQTA